jgi:hypothetical protein
MTIKSALLAALVFSANSFAATPADRRCPSVVIDTFGLAQAQLDALKASPQLCWSVELGYELLLGVQDAHFAEWQMRRGVKNTLGELRPSELNLREHACTDDSLQPNIGVVGGYEILKVAAQQSDYFAPFSKRLSISASVGNAWVASRAVREAAKQAARRAPDPQIAALVATVSSTRWLATLQSLSGFNRNTFNPDLQNAHDWIRSEFAAAGLQTSSYSYGLPANLVACNSNPAVTVRNPIGIKLGTNPNRFVVVGAHYDSRNAALCETSGVQPGANDNGSGCAGVIELARVFAPTRTRDSIIFTCFSGEEQGLLGSQSYVNSLVASGQIANIALMINLDMIAHDPTGNGIARIETIPEQQSDLYPRFVTAASTYAPELNLNQALNTQAYSDHWYFIQAGVPGIFTWENGAGIYPEYHSVNDTISALANAQMLAGGIMKMDAAVIAEEVKLIDFANGFE